MFENKKIKMKDIYFELDDIFEYDIVYKKLDSVLDEYSKYNLLLRVCYESPEDRSITEWKMLGDQITLLIGDNKSKSNEIRGFYDSLNNKLKLSFDKYNYGKNYIFYIQIILYKESNLSKTQKIRKFTKKLLGDQKDMINYNKSYEGFNRMLPLTSNKEEFGLKLDKHIINNKVDFVTLEDGSIVNFKDRNLNFSSDYDFYQRMYIDSLIIVAVKSINNINYIYVYNSFGHKIETIMDDVIDDNNFIRQLGNVKCFINSSGIYKKEINKDFNYIKPYKLTGKYTKMTYPDQMFGTLDLETYKFENKSYTYAIGFYIEDSCNIYYIDKDTNSDSLIIKCIENMLKPKYNGYVFYTHNFTGYDVFFILKVLIKLSNLFPNEYSFNLTMRDSDIIAIKVSRKINNKTYSIKLVDSLNLLQGSLDKLSKTFNTDIKKTFFPYDFVTKNNLFYIGKKPEYKYYNITKDEYNLIPDNNWSLKNETISYLKNDLISLHSIMKTFINKEFINYNVHVTKSLTISSLSMDIFLNKYYNNNIPLITTRSIFKDIKKSYFGGITEVYKPYGKNLYYYDVNSLYPFSALNSMPGLNCTYVENINKSIKDLDIFGFYYCKIKTKNNYLGLLPYRSDSGLIMPLGEWEGWYFSEELKFAYENGYDIQVILGYNFSKVNNVFDKYIKDLYEIKCTNKDPIERSLAKSKLNNLIGKFGMDVNKSITNLVSEEEFSNIRQTRAIRSFVYIEDKILVTYDKDISLEICNNNGLNINEVFNKEILSSNISNKEQDNMNLSIPIASAVTSYSRIFMNKVKLNILNNNGNIYYTDTDSIVTDLKLDDSMVGPEIGKFKLEHLIKEAYFISNKAYAFKNNYNDIIIKYKGIYTKSIDYNSFKDLYLGKDVNAYRYESNRDYSNGSVTVRIPKSITLLNNSYNKRVKLFNRKKWIDTYPITLKRNLHNRSVVNNEKYNKIFCMISITLYNSLILGFIYVMTKYLPDIDISTYMDINYNNISPYSIESDEIITKSDEKLTEGKEINSKSYFNNILNMFNNKSDYNQKYSNFCYSQVTHNSTYINKKIDITNKEDFNILQNIIDQLKNNYIESSDKEIIELKSRISFLEWHLDNSSKLLNSIITDLDNSDIKDVLNKN